MSYDKQKLIELRDKVKEGEECTTTFAKVFPVGSKRNDLLHDAFDGSLDAAKRLHDALLVGAVLWDKSHTAFGYEVSILFVDNQFDGCSKDSYARAWLIAILEALISEATQ